MKFYPEQVCVSEIEFDIQNNLIHNVHFTGGCDGNLKGIAALVEGRTIDSVVECLKDISCANSPQACPAQFAEALRCYQRGELDRLRPLSDKEIIDRQQQKWNNAYAGSPSLFGEEISYPAAETLRFLRGKQVEHIWELGCGQGRDTWAFAGQGYQVTALDYTAEGLGGMNIPPIF